jgi:hypothetical protein
MHIPSGQLSERYGRAFDRSVLCLTAPSKRRLADASIGGIKDACVDRRRNVCNDAGDGFVAVPAHVGEHALGLANPSGPTGPEPLHEYVHLSFWEDRMHEPQEVLTPTEARQASPRRLNFRVLTMSLLLAIVAAGVLYAVFYAGNTQMSTPDPAPTQQTAPGP